MIAGTNEEIRTKDTTLPANGQGLAQPLSEAAAKKHFDAFETDFFEQGDDGANLPVELDQLDDVDGGTRGKRPLLSRPSLLGLAIASTCLALLACTALWQSNAPFPALPIAQAASTKAARVEPAVNQPSAVPVPAAEPVAPAPSPSATPASDNVAKVEADPAVAAPKEEPTSDSVAKAEIEPFAVAPAAAPETNAGLRCKLSIREKRNKDILALCPAAFAEDGSDANVAVALAKVEFDRGRFAQAHAWSKKAIAINPDSADAYVFAGGAEQSKGHGKAAKEAYLHYLRLAPAGRYAAELRAIVRSL